MKRIIIAAAALFLTAGAFAQPAAENVVIFGDSYSTFQGYIPEGYATWYSPRRFGANDVTDVNQTWWMQVCTTMGYKLLENNSYSGSTVCNTGYNGQDYSDRSFVNRAEGIVSGRTVPDVILILAGTNDSWAGAPIGEVKYSDWTEKDCYSFLPAYCRMMDTLTRLAPKARIVSIINDGLKPEVTLGIAEISLHYARVTGSKVEYIQLENIDKLVNHPSVAGMKQIAGQVCEHLTK